MPLSWWYFDWPSLTPASALHKYEICDNATSAHFSDQQGSSDSEGDGASNYDTTKDTLKSSLSKHKNHHRCKYCPVWGCHAGPQLHLIRHIKREHGHIPRERRLQMTKMNHWRLDHAVTFSTADCSEHISAKPQLENWYKASGTNIVIVPERIPVQWPHRWAVLHSLAILQRIPVTYVGIWCTRTNSYGWHAGK